MEQRYNFYYNGEDYNKLKKKVDFYVRNHSSFYDITNEAFISLLLQAVTITGYFFSIFYLRIIPFNRFFLFIIIIQIALMLADVYFFMELLNLEGRDFFQQSKFRRESTHQILTISILKFMFGSPISGISNFIFWLSLSRLWKDNDYGKTGVDLYHALVLTSLLVQMLLIFLIMVFLPQDFLYQAYYLTLLVLSITIEVIVYFKRNNENFLSKPVVYGFVYTGFYLALIGAYLILRPDFYVVWKSVASLFLSTSIVFDLVILSTMPHHGILYGDSARIKEARYVLATVAPLFDIVYLGQIPIVLSFLDLFHGTIGFPHFTTPPFIIFVFIAFLFAVSLGFLVVISLVDRLLGNTLHTDYSYFNTELDPITQKVHKLMLFYKKIEMDKDKEIDNLNRKLDRLNEELYELRKEFESEENNKENGSAFNDGYNEGIRDGKKQYKELLKREIEILSKSKEKEIFALLFGINGINKLGKKDLDKIKSIHHALAKIYHPDGKDDVKEMNKIMSLINDYRDIFNKMAEDH